MNEKAGLPVIPDSREDDLHPPQTPADSQLNLFMAGNQFMMVMEALIAAFKQQHPHIQRIYYYICKRTRSPHPENAETFLHFMQTRSARDIYEQYGFIAPKG